MINVAIVGLGGIGNTHARCYQKIEGVKIVAVCDILKDRADKAAAAYGCPAFYSVKEMLASGIKIDGASMCTAGKENGGDHYQPTMELLGAGIPTLGEKPISNEVPKAKKMVALAKSKKIPYAVDLNHRFTPAADRARQWIEEGRLGSINIINLTMWINNKNESSPHFHMRALHPHSFDIMRFFGGDVAKVQAFYRKGEGRKIWSNVSANLLYKNGILGHLTGSYDATGPDGSYGLETCEIVGMKGRVIIREACQSLEFYPRHSMEIEIYKNLGGMKHFGETFLSRITAWIEDLKKKTPYDKIAGSGEEALKAQMIIEAAIKSWETGKIVNV